MTVEYHGCNLYRLYIGDKEIQLSEDEIIKIANYATESNFNTARNNSLEKDNELLMESIGELTEQRDDWSFSYKRMYEQMQTVLKEHEEWVLD